MTVIFCELCCLVLLALSILHVTLGSSFQGIQFVVMYNFDAATVRISKIASLDTKRQLRSMQCQACMCIQACCPNTLQRLTSKLLSSIIDALHAVHTVHAESDDRMLQDSFHDHGRMCMPSCWTFDCRLDATNQDSDRKSTRFWFPCRIDCEYAPPQYKVS